MLGMLTSDGAGLSPLDFKLLLAVPLIPLIGYVLQIFLRGRLPHGDKILTGGMFVVMCITVYMAAKVIGAHGEDFLAHSGEVGMELGWLYSRADVPSHLNIVTGLFYDPLGAAMLAVVGIVSFCVHLFSQGYMKGDKRYPIFFANISLFTFAMLSLVLADNILFLFVFWEIMGLMSYLLIGHFSHDPSQPFFHRWATWASKKAFMTTRIGDVCLLIGILIFYREFQAVYAGMSEATRVTMFEGGFHPLRFTHMWEMAKHVVEANGGEYPAWMTVGGLFAFGGTVGKSAQFPLHVWLPDAMAGPTPVSAMIHAATMVAAGVFLLGRLFPLLSPDVLAVVTVTGSITALVAASIGLVCYDLKAVLAYSTISQLGFMVAAVGLGNVEAGMFHMVTHAFFKACLFLSAGSVILGCHHVQDMRVMGGLWNRMPITFACTLVSTMAIAGVPFFSGFYSKDAVLLSAWANLLEGEFFGGWPLLALLCLGAGAMMTAFYMFRLIFLTFFGEYRGDLSEHRYTAMLAAEGFEGPEPHGSHGEHHDEHGHHADHGHGKHEEHAGVHESPWVMTVSLVILAVFGLPVMGWVLNGWMHSVSVLTMYGPEVGAWVRAGLPEGIADHDSHLGHASHSLALYVSLFVASTGILGAWFLYVRRRDLPKRITAKFPLAWAFLRRRYFVDEAIERTVLRPTSWLARTLRWIDEHVVDGLVNGVGRANKGGGFLAAWFDRVFVDGVVNGVGLVSQSFGSAFRLLQTGRIQQYAAFAVGGGILTAAWLILS